MDKLRMESPDMTAQNIDRIAALFPNCVTEAADGHGGIKRAINFEMLKQMLSPDVVDGDEAYEFTWVGKKAAIVEANKPIRKTLRPCVEESKNWDTTENLYIEGDNLEVLKLLQESYLGKVKMIYIDPPYNTGHDFIYNDRFEMDKQEYNQQIGLFDEEGNKQFTENTESNPRFHSDWCSMMYSRLMLARNMLSNDGVIFISIDENEIETLTKICDEVFGEVNHVGTIIVKSNPRGSMSTLEIASLHEYLLIYSKSRSDANIIGHELSAEMTSEYKHSDEVGAYRLLGLRMRGGFWRRSDRPNLFFPIYVNPADCSVSLEKSPLYCEVALPVQPSTMEDGTWRWSKEKILVESKLLVGKKITRGNEFVWDIYQKDYLERDSGRRTKAKSIWDDSEINYQNGASEIKELFGKGGIFDYSKPTFLIKQAMKMIGFDYHDIVMDFFSGSATTAHAVMQLNAEDGGHRKFIMVQLPEKCDEASEAYKAGYKTICEIGKERIRRAGEKIKSEIDVVHKDDYAALVQSQQSNDQKVMTGFDSLKSSGVLTEKGYTYTDKDTKDISRITYSAEDPNDFYRFHPNALDVGFRVLKLDDTNMKDVYYAPDDYDQGMLAGLESNIKEDRTDLDLLFGCLIDWGLPLSLPYSSEQIDGCTVHTYNDGDLIACFDANIPESVVKEIAKRKPLRAVFRDSGFASSPEKINVFEIFKLYMPEDANDINKRVRVI